MQHKPYSFRFPGFYGVSPWALSTGVRVFAEFLPGLKWPLDADHQQLYPEYLTKGDRSGTDPPELPLKVINISRGDVIIADHIKWASTGHLRRRGLLGHKTLDPMAGIYIVPCEWIHTFGMNFPIDVAFISPKGRILSIHHGLKPNRFSKIVLRAEGVLELSAGRLRVTNTEVGDQIQFMEMHNELLNSALRHIE